MKLGSSRGMDTKRPRRSERSKPCHELSLTRPSQPPYPWPPEQAQSGVSKPYRTTIAAFPILVDQITVARVSDAGGAVAASCGAAPVILTGIIGRPIDGDRRNVDGPGRTFVEESWPCAGSVVAVPRGARVSGALRRRRHVSDLEGVA